MSSLLEREISEQAAALRGRTAIGVDAAGRAAALLHGCSHVLIAARGSSDNAARYAQYLIGQELRLAVGLAAPWLYREIERAPRLPDAGVMAISQSGQSPDVIAVVAAARAQGRPTVAITNAPESELAATAEVVVPLGVGPERAVAATKTYLGSLHAVVQIVQAWSPTTERERWLDQLPVLVADAARSCLAARDRFDPLLDSTPITVTGRGLYYSSACETALKLRELSGTPAEAFSPPDLLHGPIAALHHPAATWLIQPADDLTTLSDRLEPTVIVGSDSEALLAARIPIPLTSDAPDWVSAILAVIPAQAAGLRLAERTNRDVDEPGGLRKVTRTR